MKNILKINSGDKIGNCIVIKEIEPIIFNKTEKSKRIRVRRRAVFQCVCKNTFIADISMVKIGNTKSCGCLQKAAITKISSLNKTHGQSNHPLYMTWVGMLKRCYNPKNINYSIYGGRGIKVCEEWKDINNFIKDMYSGYDKDLQLDRVNNDGNYCKENCRWVTRKLNSNNRRNNRIIEYNGLKKNLNEWARELNIPINTLIYRLNNWTIEKSFNYK